ncbi:DUF305 domain-containing protein [Neisseriaceae bacterium ESL0693]|nr:DUF305 domain-containing protein [Neisseriaceae bacterium ESL0693]
MNKCLSGLLSGLLVLGLTGYAAAAPMQTQAYKSEYQASMQRMHQEMMPAIEANNPDVAFAQGMLAHHEGAVSMAKIQLKYGHDAKMRRLAEEIIREQQAQIKILQQWLQQHR